MKMSSLVKLLSAEVDMSWPPREELLAFASHENNEQVIL